MSKLNELTEILSNSDSLQYRSLNDFEKHNEVDTVQLDKKIQMKEAFDPAFDIVKGRLNNDITNLNLGLDIDTKAVEESIRKNVNKALSEAFYSRPDKDAIQIAFSDKEGKQLSALIPENHPKIEELCQKLTDHLVDNFYSKPIETYKEIKVNEIRATRSSDDLSQYTEMLTGSDHLQGRSVGDFKFEQGLLIKCADADKDGDSINHEFKELEPAFKTLTYKLKDSLGDKAYDPKFDITNAKEELKDELIGRLYETFNAHGNEEKMFDGLVFQPKNSQDMISPLVPENLPKIKELCEKLADHLIENHYTTTLDTYDRIKSHEPDLSINPNDRTR